VEKELNSLRSIIRQLVKESILREDETPGGPITDLGAEKIVNPSDYMSDFRKALVASDGIVKKAARTLGIATRTAHYHIAQSPELQKVKIKARQEARRARAERRKSIEKSSSKE